MKAELQIKRVEDAMVWLETSAQDYTASQSIPWLIDQVGMLCNTMAFVNNQMAVAKKELNKKKVSEYNTLAISSKANEEYYSPSLAKDYIAAKCAEEQYYFDICERTSRTVTHTLEALRTCISALKEEVKVQNYQMQ
jgi:hypothetical protein